MIGAMIGDIAGSQYEGTSFKKKEFDMFGPRCHPTDDSVMTIAVADAILKCSGDYQNLGAETVHAMQYWGRKYPHAGYGRSFISWLQAENPRPYHSWGNGSAMRVSPCAWAAETLDEAIALSRAVTVVTHDHPEGIKGAEAVAAAIFLALHGSSKDEIRSHIESGYYPLDFTLDQIRPSYRFDVSCQGSVPQAIEAFLEAESFEEAVRGAVSLGGDTDTQAAIAGSIAEAYYRVPEFMRQQALCCLDSEQQQILERFEDRFGVKAEEGYDLSRFHKAQALDYPEALREIRQGRKRSHWIWYIFPQLRGLGYSTTSMYYGLSGFGEASAYIGDAVLRDHLLEISQALLTHTEQNITGIMGYPDDLKLRSSMTLFAVIAPEYPVFQQVLDRFFDGRQDEKTLKLLQG